MSGFFVSMRPKSDSDARRILSGLQCVEGEWSMTICEGAFSLFQVRGDREDLWGPAFDPISGVVVALGGRIALAETDWERAQALPYRGGLACRHILDLFLSDQVGFADHLNGAFGVMVGQMGEPTMHVATDRMGFFPLYAWRTSGSPIVATHPDVLAAHTGASSELDMLSMAEVVATGTVTHPHTYYRGIEVLEPGCVFTCTATGPMRRRSYWTPHYRENPGAGVEELGEELELALRGAVQRRTLPVLGSTGVFLSGGADSRAVLYAAHEPGAVTSITFYDIPNAELKTAQALAQRVGSRHVGLQRDFEHYGLGASRAVRITGGTWNILDAHYTEFLHQILSLGLDNLLSGCYADYFFKGLTSNRAYKTLLGRNLPIYDLAPFFPHWFGPQGQVAQKWKSPIEERIWSAYDGLDVSDGSDAGRWEVELRRIWPAAREATTATRLLLLRTLPWESFLADTELIEVYQQVPPSLKLNGQVWENAVARICREAGDIVNNNSLSRIGASQLERTMRFLRGVAHRKVFRRDVDGTPLDGSATRGSWPDFDHYFRHSMVVPELWSHPSETTRDVLGDILGTDPWSHPMEQWLSGGDLIFGRLITLKLWLDQR